MSSTGPLSDVAMAQAVLWLSSAALCEAGVHASQRSQCTLPGSQVLQVQRRPLNFHPCNDLAPVAPFPTASGTADSMLPELRLQPVLDLRTWRVTVDGTLTSSFGRVLPSWRLH